MQQTGTSLVVQWLRFCSPRAGGLGSIPDQGTRPHVLQLTVHMPQLNKTYTAIKGEGAFLNQTKKLCVRKPSTKLIGACDITKHSIDDIKKILLNNNNVDIRSLYCTGVELCYIANGCMDFLFLKNSAFEWDFIGPKLILEEAGGLLECIKQQNGSYNIVAGSKEAVQQVKNIININ